MRLLFVSSMRGSPWGGSEPLWTGAAERAITQGHSVAVSVFDWPEPASKVVELGRAGAKLFARPLRVGRLESWLREPAWVRAFDEFAPEAVCLSQGGAYECVGRRSTRPIARWVLRYTGRVVNLVQYNAETRLRSSVRNAAAALYERSDVNAFVAQRNIEQAQRTLGVRVPRATVVRNPVNLHDLTPMDWCAPIGSDGTLRLACVARLDMKVKGQGDLIEALAGQAWRARDWTLSLVGQGPDRERLVELIERRGLSRRVALLGQLSDLREVWRDHHALVLASRAEGTPLSMVEAMLLARPCVVTDVGGCTEWVRDGQDGCVSPRADAASIAAALERLWNVRESLREMGLSARARAFSLYDPDPHGTILKHMLASSQQNAPDRP